MRIGGKMEFKKQIDTIRSLVDKLKQESYRQGNEDGIREAELTYKHWGRTGYWIMDEDRAFCSECGYMVNLMDGESHYYCQNCGSKNT